MRLRAYFKRLGDRGNTTVEFAVIGPTFLLLLLAVFELGYMVLVQSVLDSAARDAARMVRTGQVQTTGSPQATFQNQLCSDVGYLIGCTSLLFQSQVFPSWSAAAAAVNAPPQRDALGNLVSVGFNPGAGKDIVAVQVSYNYKFFTLWIASYLGSGGSQSTFLMSTVVFQNEPFA
jgi:Flp pilus assembly protein TadG